MSEASPPPFKLFLDRSTQGRRFVEAVRRLVPDVETINDRYGMLPAERVADTRWIADAAGEGYILVGADRNILRNRLERHELCRNSARYVVFGNNNMPMRTMINLFEVHLPRIRSLAGVPGPWVCRIAHHGIDRLTVNCSDFEA